MDEDDKKVNKLILFYKMLEPNVDKRTEEAE